MEGALFSTIIAKEVLLGTRITGGVGWGGRGLFQHCYIQKDTDIYQNHRRGGGGGRGRGLN